MRRHCQPPRLNTGEARSVRVRACLRHPEPASLARQGNAPRRPSPRRGRAPSACSALTDTTGVVVRPQVRSRARQDCGSRGCSTASICCTALDPFEDRGVGRRPAQPRPLGNQLPLQPGEEQLGECVAFGRGNRSARACPLSAPASTTNRGGCPGWSSAEPILPTPFDSTRKGEAPRASGVGPHRSLLIHETGPSSRPTGTPRRQEPAPLVPNI